MEFNRPTWVEVDLGNLRKNYREIQKTVGKRKIICVVKADAYGHGSIEVSRILQDEGAFGLAVASMEEALALRENGIKMPILTLGYVDPKTLDIAARTRISVTLFDKNFIKRLKEYTGNEALYVHVDVDTGMGRLGIFPEEALKVIEEISEIKNVKIEGIYTHFASAENDRKYSIKQISSFKKILSELKKKNLLPEIIHAANSAAVSNFKESYFNAVRPGIALYGLAENSSYICRPVLSFKTRVIFSRIVPKGYSISYGRTYTTKKDELLATIPVGYADGLSRLLSNKGEVLVKGLRAKIVGNVTMDLTVINVTNFPYIHPGNEVVIIGTQGNNTITADEIAQITNTINYEVVTRIGKRVKRIYKDIE